MKKAFVNGKIYTCNKEKPWAEAMAIEDFCIAQIGTDEEIAQCITEDTEVTDLQGQFVMPGIIDSHCHAFGMSVIRFLHIPLMEAGSCEEILETLKGYVQEHPEEEVYRGYGWYNGFFENGIPTADLLDEIIPDKLAMMRSLDGHSVWVNTAFMNEVGITAETPDPEGGTIERYPDGRPNGCFRDQAATMMIDAFPSFSVEEFMEAICISQAYYASLGYTAYYEATVNESGNERIVEAYRALDEQNMLRQHVSSGYLVDPQCGDIMGAVDKAIEWNKLTKDCNFEVTDVKFFIDGVVEGRTAYLKDGYSDEPDFHGMTRWQSDELKEALAEAIAKANEAGMSCHFHTIGDGALSDALDAIEKAQAKTGRDDCRNTVTHLQVVDPADIKRMVDLKVIAALDPWGYKQEGYYEETEVPYLGERVEREYPYKTLLDAGVFLTAATDFPAGLDVDPLSNIQIFATRQKSGDPSTLLNPAEALPLDVVIDMYTKNGAYMFKKENLTGSLEPGKLADFVVMDRNLMETDLNEIETIQRNLVVVGGNVIFDIENPPQM